MATVFVAFLQFIAIGVQAIFLWLAFKATKKSADIAEASLVKLQRAFVSIQQIKYLSHLDTRNGKIWWTIHVTWENSGSSPTRELTCYVERYLEDMDIPVTFAFNIPDVPRQRTFLGPKASVASGELAVTGDDLNAVQNGQKFLYLWGRADYRDVFDNTPNHVTKFFVRVFVRGDPSKAWNQTDNIVEILFNNQDRHNCADEECD